MKMSGSVGLFNKNKQKMYLVGSPKVGGAGDGKHKQKYGHPNMNPWNQSICVMIIYNINIYITQIQNAPI